MRLSIRSNIWQLNTLRNIRNMLRQWLILSSNFHIEFHHVQKLTKHQVNCCLHVPLLIIKIFIIENK